MFLHLSVILFTGGGLPQCMLGYHPPRSRPPRSRPPLTADTPWKQTHPPEADPFPPGSRPPQKQTPPCTVLHAGRYGQQAGSMHPTATMESFLKILSKKECIPVGCIPPAWWPYPVVSHVSQGDLHPGGSASSGVCIQGRASASRGVCLQKGGLPPGGGWADPPDADPLIMWSRMHAGKPTPLPCGQTNTCENITLPKLRLRAVINFMA